MSSFARAAVIAFAVALASPSLFAQGNSWQKMDTLPDWTYSYFLGSDFSSTRTGGFDFCENGILVHIERRGKDAVFIGYDVSSKTIRKDFEVRVPGVETVGGQSLRIQGATALSQEITSSGTLFYFDDSSCRSATYDASVYSEELIERPLGNLVFSIFPFVLWELDGDSAGRYHSIELQSSGEWLYRDPAETIETMKANVPASGTVRIDKDNLIIDGSRLFASNPKTFQRYFSGQGSSVVIGGDFIGFDAVDNYYFGSVSGIQIVSKSGRLIRSIQIKDPAKAMNTEVTFPVRVDPFGTLYTIRFDPPSKSVELWKLDTGVISEERSTMLRGNAASSFYEKLRKMSTGVK